MNEIADVAIAGGGIMGCAAAYYLSKLSKTGLKVTVVEREEIGGWERIAIASGHFRSGILQGPVTGKLIAPLILDGHTELSLEPFSHSRFATRDG